MAPLQPTYRTFVAPETLPEKQSYPAPEGISLIVSPIYTKVVLFTEYDDKRGSIPINKLEKAIAKALSTFHLYAGRLSPESRGRYTVQDFDKGCLFQVCELPDSFEEYKKNRFGYGTVPIADLMPLHFYTSLDAPVMGVQLTQLQGGQAVGFSFLHRLSDGLGDTLFIYAVACALRNEELPIQLYYDWERPPLQPNPKYDHSIDYPLLDEMPEREMMDMDQSIKRVFAITEPKAEELRRQMEQEISNKNVKLSVRDALTAFMYRAIIKARRIKGQCDLVYVVSKRYAHPDKRMMMHFGNYLAAITIPEKHDELMRRPISSSAQRIRQQVANVNHEFMDSLEHYLNNVQDPSMVYPPVHRMTRGCVLWSDWSRFASAMDFGYGKPCSYCRSWVNPSPMAVVTMAPTVETTFELVVQLDPDSMERLINDKQVQYYALGAF